MVTLEQIDQEIAEIRKDLRILELEREVLKLKTALQPTIVSTPRAWDP